MGRPVAAIGEVAQHSHLDERRLRQHCCWVVTSRALIRALMCESTGS